MISILDRLDHFIAGIDRSALTVAARRLREMSEAEASHLVDTYLGEMRTGLKIIEPHLRPGQRILEVGCGIGVLSTFLLQEGFEVVGIEPGEDGGFSFMTALHLAAAEQFPEAIRPEILRIGAEDLSPEVHGRFDVIFSANVLEHIMALDAAIPALQSVLAPDGVMRHLCPNYLFLYEPHLGIPLIPVFPAATRHLFRKTIAENREIWDSLNFITERRIRALARRSGLQIDLDGGIMGDFMRRLTEDEAFAQRQAGILGALARRPALVARLARILDAVPPRMATPMAMTLRHSS